MSETPPEQGTPKPVPEKGTPKPTPEKKLAAVLKPDIQGLIKQFSEKPEGSKPNAQTRSRLVQTIVRSEPVKQVTKKLEPTPQGPKTSKEEAEKATSPDRSGEIRDAILGSWTISPVSKERFTKLSDPGQQKLIEFVKELKVDNVPEWKFANKLGEVEFLEPGRVAEREADLKKQKGPQLSGTEEAKQQKAASIDVQIDASNKRAREQRAAAEKDMSPLGQAINKALEFADITAGAEYCFRAISVDFAPWRIIKEGFTRNPKNRINLTVLQVIEELYCDYPDGAAEYMGLYRGGTKQNDSRLNLPFTSAGPLMSESQGASGSDWQYAVVKRGVGEVSIDRIQAQLPRPIKHADKLGDLKLFADGDLASASLALLKHGPMGEETWITAVPASCIIAFTSLRGPDWMQRWTYLKDADRYLEICKATPGGDRVTQMWK